LSASILFLLIVNVSQVLNVYYVD